MHEPTESELQAWRDEWLAKERPRPLIAPEAVIDWAAFVAAKRTHKELDKMAREKLMEAYDIDE